MKTNCSFKTYKVSKLSLSTVGIPMTYVLGLSAVVVLIGGPTQDIARHPRAGTPAPRFSSGTGSYSVFFFLYLLGEVVLLTDLLEQEQLAFQPDQVIVL